MNKKLTLLLCVLLMNTLVKAQTNNQIHFTTEIIKHGPVFNGGSKTPIKAPTVCIDSYTLYFQASHPEFVLNILKDDENVYTCIVNTNVTTLELPSFLLGEYEIQLIAEPYCFIGYITL